MNSSRRKVIGPALPPKEPSLDEGTESIASSAREEWMTVPPEDRLDPLSIKPRQFSRKSARTPIIPSAEDETEVEKAKEEAKEKEELIEQYNARYRPHSLYSIHQDIKSTNKKAKHMEKESFDWDRDMNQNVKRPSQKYTNDMMTRAGDLSGRFTPGSGSKKFL